MKTLKKGDQVVVDLSIQGEDGRWCEIRESGHKEFLGYAQCEYLEFPQQPKLAATTATPGSADVQQPSASTAAAARPSGVRTSYAKILAATFQFTSGQKQQILCLAERNGIPECAEDTDSYVRRGVQPPDLLSSAPVTKCSWYAQSFDEQVFALITPEQKAASRASYDSHARELAGNRRVLEMKSRGRELTRLR